MTTKEVEAMVKSYIDQANNDLSKENIKFDFKLKWYALKEETKKELMDFLKDVSAIANTPGLDGVIAIGFSDKDKTFQDTILKDSGAKDSNEINGLISSNIDRAFDINVWDTTIDGHKLSIIHIPPSITKPHVLRNVIIRNNKGEIRNEEHRIYIRRNTSNSLATKSDLDSMYYDNRNIVPDYEVYVHADKNQGVFNSAAAELGYSIPIVIENTGRRAIAIKRIEITFDIKAFNKIESLIFFLDPQFNESVIPSNGHLKITSLFLSSIYSEASLDVLKARKVREFETEISNNTITISKFQVIIFLRNGKKIIPDM
jgi:hypothetical protein